MTRIEQAHFDDLRADVERALESCFALTFPPQQTSEVSRAAAYSLLGGGKRVRGVLALAACQLVCGDASVAAPYAAALEMLHAYSLIHDDLPCMDDDDYRRGQPSCHKAFDEATALLAGDALLTAAFRVLCTGPDAVRNAAAVQALAQAAGPAGMVLGQELDLAAEAHPVDAAGLAHIHENKTGRLIRAAVALGGIAGGAADVQLQALDAYAAALGLAFQIMDDVLDVEADEAALGKPVGSDARQHKTTYVTLYGVAKARRMAAEVTQQGCETLRAVFGAQADCLCAFADSLAVRAK